LGSLRFLDSVPAFLDLKKIESTHKNHFESVLVKDQEQVRFPGDAAPGQARESATPGHGRSVGVSVGLGTFVGVLVVETGVAVCVRVMAGVIVPTGVFVAVGGVPVGIGVGEEEQAGT